MEDTNIEISYSCLGKKDKDKYEIIDIRSAEAFALGHIAGAINIEEKDILQPAAKLNKSKEYIICCKSGTVSIGVAQKLVEAGYIARSLSGGYTGWLKDHLVESLNGNKTAQIEDSLRKNKYFHKNIFSQFCKGINEYQLLSQGDKVAVCISGGKDSMLMAKLFQELKRHNKFNFELVFLVMDPGYSKENREIIEKNAALMGIPLTIFETNIFDSVFKVEKSPCYLCARMRRGHLYNQAKILGCNKIALGHHYDDVIETILMGMLYGGQVQTMMPKLKSTNFEGMELIRPMYLVREKDIIKWRDYNNLHFIQCACRFTNTCSDAGCNIDYAGSKRKKVKGIIASIAKEDPQIEDNIFKSVENVNLSTIISYKDATGKHRFTDLY